MPRFSLKDLLVAMLLIALGIFLVVLPFHPAPIPKAWQPDLEFILIVFAWCAGCSLIGAGMAKPFHRARLGAGVGVAFGIVTLVVVLNTYLKVPNPSPNSLRSLIGKNGISQTTPANHHH